MNHIRSSDATLSLAALDQIDQACLEFEAAWQAGGRPSIEPCLAGWQGLERATPSIPRRKSAGSMAATTRI